MTFRGNATVLYIAQLNPLIGPTQQQLVAFGALFPLCMRENHLVNVQQIQALYPQPGKGGKGRLGCCEVPKFIVAGTATEVRLLLKLP